MFVIMYCFKGAKKVHVGDRATDLVARRTPRVQISDSWMNRV